MTEYARPAVGQGCLKTFMADRSRRSTLTVASKVSSGPWTAVPALKHAAPLSPSKTSGQEANGTLDGEWLDLTGAGWSLESELSPFAFSFLQLL